jgi:hypothetical protein
MLIFAEGTVRQTLSDVERAAVQAWIGPMVDDGLMHAGYINIARDRVWILLSRPTSRLPHSGLLPVVRDGAVSFSTTEVRAMRFH